MKRRKFTLIEMLVVICIIGILMSLFLVGVQHAVNAAKRTKFLGGVATMRATLEQYKNKNGSYPAADYDACYPILGIIPTGTRDQIIAIQNQKVRNPWSNLDDAVDPTDVFSIVDMNGDGILDATDGGDDSTDISSDLPIPQSSAAWTKDSSGKVIKSWE